MISFETLSLSKYRTQALALFESAFPINERPETRLVLDRNPQQYHFDIILFDNMFAGIFCYWTFGNLFYAEHFAIDESLRNRKIGAEVIESMKKRYPLDWVFEVELPIDPMPIRRINFYYRLGFVMQPIVYHQPPYRPSEKPTKMIIMSNNVLQNDILEAYIKTIHKNVYAVD